MDRKVVTKFLELEPRPTPKELIKVLFPKDLKIPVTSQDWLKYECWYPDPNKAGYLKKEKWPCKKYLKAIKDDGQKQQQIMQEIIDSRRQKIEIKIS